MADPYIDPFETQIYGKFAREQMAAVCLGRVPELDPMVRFAIAAQKEADEAMAALIAKQPKAANLDPAEVIPAAADVIVRFGRHLESHKRGTVDPKDFFRGDVPSVLARRRLTKLSAGAAHILSKIGEHKATLREPDHWMAEFTEVVSKLQALEKQQRAAKVKQVDLGPEIEAGRQAWLAKYNANKLLVRGLLGHAGKPDLLPLIFDDLAEVHRVSGVSDEVPSSDDDTQADGEGPPHDDAKTP
jgi:hypothetical protein